MYLAFSIIQIARNKYLDKNLINNDLYFQLINLYGVNFNDYEKCYFDLKKELKEIKIEKVKETSIVKNDKEKMPQLNNKTLSADKYNNSNKLKQKFKSNVNLVNLKGINSPNKEIKVQISKEEKVNKIISYKAKNNSDDNKVIKENCKEITNDLNVNRIFNINTVNEDTMNIKSINIINNNDNGLNNINMNSLNLQEKKNKNTLNDEKKNDINNNKDKSNKNIIINRKKIKSKSHISISCKTNNYRNNIRYKSNNIMPLSIFNSSIKDVDDKKVVSDKNLIFETNIFNNNKCLKPITNFNSIQNKKFRISKNKDCFQSKEYIIPENSNNDQLFSKNEIYNSKNKSRKDVSNFKSYEFFNLKFHNINGKTRNKMSSEYEKNNNDSNSRRLFKSTDKFLQNHLGVSRKMITFKNNIKIEE